THPPLPPLPTRRSSDLRPPNCDGVLHPATTNTHIAPTSVVANTAATSIGRNPLRNVPAYSAPSFRSIIGPDTRNASCAAGPNCTNDAATNASDSEQSEPTVA